MGLMEIIEISDNKKQFLQLLLLADEQEDMIDRYLEAGRMFVLFNNGPQCLAVITEVDEQTCELKNIATRPESQGLGYASYLLEYIIKLYKNQYDNMLVGTGGSTVNFYQKLGFVFSHIIKNFYVDNYHLPIIEHGQEVRDMLYLAKKL